MQKSPHLRAFFTLRELLLNEMNLRIGSVSFFLRKYQCPQEEGLSCFHHFCGLAFLGLDAFFLRTIFLSFEFSWWVALGSRFFLISAKSIFIKLSSICLYVLLNRCHLSFPVVMANSIAWPSADFRRSFDMKIVGYCLGAIP